MTKYGHVRLPLSGCYEIEAAFCESEAVTLLKKADLLN